MIRMVLAAGVLVSMASAAAFAQAAPPAPSADASAQALGRCFTLKSTGADRIAVARWMLASIASAPQVADIAAVKPEVRVALDKGMAALFTRLLAVDCAAESRVLFRAGNSSGFEVAGEALGRVAMTELLGDPKASAALAEYTKYLNKNDFKAVLP